MSAEGILRNPAIFLYQQQQQQPKALACTTDATTISTTSPPSLLSTVSLFELFSEYCELSMQYAKSNGWSALDHYLQQKHPLEESRQIYCARQHLFWMLNKRGHGRSVRFMFISHSNYRKHTQLLTAVNDARTLTDLLIIAKHCLVNEYGTMSYSMIPEEFQ